MTYHISNIPDYECKSCDKLYIPYYKDFHCPYCNTPSKESFDLIIQIVDSLKIHKMSYGRFTPDARYTGSFAEYIQSKIFFLLDNLENQQKKNSNICDEKLLQNILDKYVKKQDLKEVEYIKLIAIESYKLYKKQLSEEKITEEKIEEDLSIPSFIRKRLKNK